MMQRKGREAAPMQVDEIYHWEECSYADAMRSEVGQYHDGSRWKRGCHCLVKRHRRLVKVDPKPGEEIPAWLAYWLIDSGHDVERKMVLGSAGSYAYRVAKESNNGQIK